MARTPLLIRGYGGADEHGRPHNALPRRPDGTAFVPGSSLKGAIRSLHETLTGSCLRVFDPDFVPSYRDVVQVRDTRRMAVVDRPPDGDVPPTIRLCEPGDMSSCRLDQHVLEELARSGLRSGDRLDITGWNGKGGRPDRVHRDDNRGEWVVFLSDDAARAKKDPYRAHVRKLGAGEPVEIPTAVWEEFRTTVGHTDDQRTARRDATTGQRTERILYKQNGKEAVLVGERHLAGPDLVHGQPIWLDVDRSGRISRLGLAMVWRHLGEVPSGARAAGFLPCDDADHLCPSCRMFGSIDPNGSEADERAAQRAYRGHVRFGDAVATRAIEPQEPVLLPPMGAPRPGAGQAYLENSRSDIGRFDEPPLREWGSSADQPEARKLRGRKHYWQNARLNGRQTARDHQRKDGEESTDLTTTAELFPQDTKLNATITFVDIDSEQLGGLLAALQPSALLDDPDLRTHVGGGKPLGFGGCQVKVVFANSELHESGARYGVASETRDIAAEFPALLKAFHASMDPALRGPVAKVLHPKSVPNGQVWYPPGAGWAMKNRPTFDEGYDFWTNTSGGKTSPSEDDRKNRQGNGFPLRVLPAVNATDQSMPIGGAPEGEHD